jgi:hypothetical protein
MEWRLVREYVAAMRVPYEGATAGDLIGLVAIFGVECNDDRVAGRNCPSSRLTA